MVARYPDESRVNVVYAATRSRMPGYVSAAAPTFPMLGTEVRQYFAGQPQRNDEAVILWMKHDCHVFDVHDGSDEVEISQYLPAQ